MASPPWSGNTSFANITADAEGQFLAVGGWSDPRGGWRTVPAIDDGASGTYYFQIRSSDPTPNCYWGLTDYVPGTDDWGHEEVCGPQIRMIETNGLALAAMDGPTQTLLASGLNPDYWYGVWLVVDNATDTYAVYYNTIGPARSQGSHLDKAILGAAGLAFRNGATGNALSMFVQEDLVGTDGGAQQADNLRYDPTASTPALIGVEIVSWAPTGKTYENQLVLEVVLRDVYSEVDEATLVLSLDGSSVIPDSVSKAGTTTTVSYASGTLGWGQHTAGIAVAGKNPVSETESQAWTFEVAEAGRITYVDATSGASGNTAAWDGNTQGWVEFNPPANGTYGADNQWERETFANGGTWFESNREGDEDAPQLRTSVTGLPHNTYDVYAYFWHAGGQGMLLGAALTNDPSGGLPLYRFDSAGVTAAALIDFSDPAVLVTESDRTMYQVYLGTVTGTRVDAYIDDEAYGGYDSTVWYDGIGYAINRGAVQAPPLAYAFSPGTLTLSWPEAFLGWTLEKNADGLDVPAGWAPVPGSAENTVFAYPLDPADPAVFFRLSE